MLRALYLGHEPKYFVTKSLPGSTYPYIVDEYVKYRILNASAEFPKGESTA